MAGQTSMYDKVTTVDCGHEPPAGRELLIQQDICDMNDTIGNTSLLAPNEAKAGPNDYLGRFREIICDPLNLLIERHPRAGMVRDDLVCLHNGNLVAASGPLAYYQTFSQVLIINRGVHEPLEEFVFQEVLKLLPPAPTMLELGAYWAHYSMWLKRRFPDATTFMVEPDAMAIDVGRTNFERNGFTGTFIQDFVDTGRFEVDRFMRERPGMKLDILHVDIQSFEVQMLEGSIETLTQNRADNVFISTHSQPIHDAIVARLGQLGMRVEVSSGFDTGTTSYDGFVFATPAALPPVFTGFKPIDLYDILTGGPDDYVALIQQAHAARRQGRGTG